MRRDVADGRGVPGGRAQLLRGRRPVPHGGGADALLPAGHVHVDAGGGARDVPRARHRVREVRQLVHGQALCRGLG